MPSKHPETISIHGGEKYHQQAVVTPIYQSSTFLDDNKGDYDNILYARMSNTPSHDALHEKIAALEGAEASLATSSGMAAITTVLLDTLSAGDHLVVQDCVYGGTHSFITEILSRYGVETTFISTYDSSGWQDAFRDNTRAMYCEGLTNPLLGITDLPKLLSLTKERGVLSIIDNTFLTPVQFRPISRGFELVVHSGTKYLNGHTDLICGCVSGSEERITQIKHTCNHLGGSLDPHGCFLMARGMKTLALRVQAQARNAQAIAEFLESHPRVLKVNYPGLKSHPRHDLASQLFDGFGAMLSFELDGDVAYADRMLEKLQYPLVAPSLGGVESLITRPSITSHAGVPAKNKLAMGITETLVRLSVGLESVEDLQADFNQAFDNA